MPDETAFEYDEGDVSHLCDLLVEMRAAANRGDDHSMVSPLAKIEGQIRYQLKRKNRLIADLPCDPDTLKTPQDFAKFSSTVSNIKAAFLLDFLKLLLGLRLWPALITDSDIAEFRQSLRSFYLLTEAERNGSLPLDDRSFRKFAFIVWCDLPNRDRASAQQWWNSAVRRLESIDGTGSFKMGGERYVAMITNPDEQNKKIRVVSDSGKIATGRPKSFGQIKNLWVEWKEDFIKQEKAKGKAKENLISG